MNTVDGDTSTVFMWGKIYTYSRGLGYDHLPMCRVQLTRFLCSASLPLKLRYGLRPIRRGA